jgi:hypothetical protein
MIVCEQKSGFLPSERRTVDPEQRYRRSKDRMLIYKPVNIRYIKQFIVRVGKSIESFALTW